MKPEHVLIARWGVLFALLVIALYQDITHGKIRNWITGSAFVLGLLLSYAACREHAGFYQEGLFQGPDSPSAADSALGAAVCFLPFFVLYLKGGFGEADVKLIAAVGALTGFYFSIWAMFFSSIVAVMMATALLVWKNRFWEYLKRSLLLLVLVKPKFREGETPLTIPYGVAISVGTFWAYIMFFVVVR